MESDNSVAEDLIEKVTALVQPILEEEGLELVEVEFKRGAHRSFLRLFIDKPGGVTLDDCSVVSTQLGDLLDVEDPIPHRYILEVSSPGANRPLKRREDYERFLGRLVQITTRQPVGGQNPFTGRLVAFANGKVSLEVPSHGTVTLGLAEIERARLELEL
ncbi:MAG: ribosome maturation factor RimP [Candidatus Tectimicrobiota bacterium]